MNDIWNEICFELGACIKNNALEKEYENAVCNCMVQLGWKKFRGEVITQYPVQAGHESKYADVVILKDGIEQFVIEVKRPSHTIQEEDEKQLFSYMRLLKHKVNFGLYIGDTIRLYYDDTASRQFPEHVFSLRIEENNPDGIKFVELFSKESYTPKALADFCNQQKERLNEYARMQEELSRLLLDQDGQLFKDALKKNYILNGYSEEWADSLLDNIVLKVSSKTDRQDDVLTATVFHKPNPQTSTHDKTRFGIMGSHPLSKRRFVWTLLSDYVSRNPKTYAEYDKIFNDLKPDAQGLIKRVDELHKNQYRNYYMNDRDILRSKDGILFVVCNQWTIDNIQPVIQWANLRGYNVAIYK